MFNINSELSYANEIKFTKQLPSCKDTVYRSAQWFSTFFKSRTPKLSNLLLRTPHKSTQIDTNLE